MEIWATVLVVVVAAVALALWKRRTLGILWYTLRHGVPQMANQIDLVEEQEPAWRHGRQVHRIARELRQKGFEPLAAYRIPQLQDMLWWAFQHPKEGVVAAITDHPLMGCATEFVLSYRDGTSLTVSNNGMAGGLDEPPGHVKHYVGGAPLEALLALLQQHRQDKEVRRFDRESFPRHVQEVFAEEMKWRNDKGGTNPDEVRRNLAGSGQAVDADTARQVARQSNQSHFALVRQECLANYLDQAKVSVARYEDWRGRLLVVLPLDDREAIREVLEDFFSIEGELAARLASLPADGAAAAFRARFAELFPKGRLLGGVEQPARADIYLLPESRG
jgi:hypothetical protein